MVGLLVILLILILVFGGGGYYVSRPGYVGPAAGFSNIMYVVCAVIILIVVLKLLGVV
jgi:hypothetical protein